MKHRSVIAFVIIAAALFAAPQLSHDLQSLRSGLGARLRGELLQAFLNLHPADGASATPAARGAHALFASCTKEKAVEPAAKSKKGESRAAAERQTEETISREPSAHLAMITEPGTGPGGLQAQDVRAEIDPIGEALAARGELATEVAMIIPPGSGLELPPPPPAPAPAVADLSAARAKAHEAAVSRRKEVEQQLRRVTFVATGFDGRQVNIQGPAEDALRRLSEALPGSFEFRLDRNGSKSKLPRGIKRAVEAGRPASSAPAPRAVKLPGAVACVAAAADVEIWSAGE